MEEEGEGIKKEIADEKGMEREEVGRRQKKENREKKGWGKG